ncbi:hypothetical protein Ancab_015600 [Ancistrocladus abbreviatus]
MNHECRDYEMCSIQIMLEATCIAVCTHLELTETCSTMTMFLFRPFPFRWPGFQLMTHDGFLFQVGLRSSFQEQTMFLLCSSFCRVRIVKLFSVFFSSTG